MTYSQINQDIAIVDFYKGKENGFFVDIGASDGIAISNTYLLEQKYNWKGICVEPVPNSFSQLVKNRTAYCSNKAVFSRSNDLVKFDISHYNGNAELSGIQQFIDCYKNFVDENKTTVEVITVTLNDLLEEANAPSFMEYLSIDTEGSELEILKHLDFKKYVFGRIDVEHNRQEPRRTELRELLTLNGYKFLKENDVDDCYVHSSLCL
jgi:FkbM family methyltransferase